MKIIRRIILGYVAISLITLLGLIVIVSGGTTNNPSGSIGTPGEDSNGIINSAGFISPLNRQDIVISQKYGVPAFQDPGGLLPTIHKGLDMVCPIGEPIYAVADGTIIENAYEDTYGAQITTLLLNDETRILYVHTSTKHVNVGDKIHQGQHIVDCGATGFVTGPHLHIEIIHNGKNFDPAQHLPINVQVESSEDNTGGDETNE